MKHDDFWKLADLLIREDAIVVERPKGTTHPKFPQLVYPIDYGYVNNIHSSDGEELDVWIGTNDDRNVVGLIITIDILKKDSEVKYLFACNAEEILEIEQFHNSSSCMKGILLLRGNDE